MKLKLAFVILLTPIYIFSQANKFSLDNVNFIKTESGYLIYGNTADNFTLTKYDNQLNKVKEFSKNVKDIKFKVPSFKRFPNYMQLIFLTKLFPAKGYVIKIDTNLNVIQEKEFASADYENLKKQGTSLQGDKFYPSLSFEDEKTITHHYTYYDDQIAIFDWSTKKIVFGKHNNSDVITYYDKINTSDVSCEGKMEVGGCGFLHLNNKLFFFIKTKTDEIKTKMSVLGGKRSASIGELIVGEIDTKKNAISYSTKISDINPDFDFSLDKLFYDSSMDKLVVAGTYLDNASFEDSKAKAGSEWTGWYAVTLDATGKMGSHRLTKNDNRVFDNVKEKTQSNRRTTIKNIEVYKDGYIFTAELAAKINFNAETGIPGMSNSIRTFQPFGFYRFDLNNKLELTNSVFYPAKVWHKIKFEDVENANIVRPGECRGQAYCISNTQHEAILYTFGKNIILCKGGKEYSFVQELLSADVEVHGQDMSAIARNSGLLDMFNENTYVNPNTTWYYPFDNKTYYLIQWKPKEITFNLMSY